jgi:hypothetical protein
LGTAPLSATIYLGVDEEFAVNRYKDHVELTENEASGGIKEQGVRYVLAVSLLLAVVAMSLMWIIPAVTN